MEPNVGMKQSDELHTDESPSIHGSKVEEYPQEFIKDVTLRKRHDLDQSFIY